MDLLFEGRGEEGSLLLKHIKSKWQRKREVTAASLTASRWSHHNLPPLFKHVLHLYTNISNVTLNEGIASRTDPESFDVCALIVFEEEPFD